MAQLKVTDLDFFGIRQNLRTFLEGQSEFSDYNFDGSGLAVLLDVLAYNTHYNATLAHLLSNEMFIDSAIKRSSAVSIAKALGYTPTSRRSARIDVTIILTPPTSYTSNTFTLSKNTAFSGVGLDGKTYKFYPDKDVSVTKIDGKFTIEVTLIEGTRTRNTFTVNADTLSGPFEIINKDVDTTTISVSVIESVTSATTSAFYPANNVLSITDVSQVYFIEENASGLIELRFGDNVLGKQLSQGNIVVAEYQVSNAALANGIGSISLTSHLIGTGENLIISNAVSSSGGAERQSLDSIRFNAPKVNATKNRAVTVDDYSALIQSEYANVNSISIWGGEDNDPPIYGKVFVSIEPLPGSFVTDTDKNLIANSILKPRGVVGIQPVFVDPTYLYVSMNITSRYNIKNTTATTAAIKDAIATNVSDYFVNTVSKVKKSFYYSELLQLINTTSQAIYSTDIELNLHRAYAPYLNSNNRIELSYNTSILPNSIRSNEFNTVLPSGKSVVCYLRDSYQEDTTTLGTLSLYDNTNTLITSGVGTIDYTTGKIVITSLYISSIYGTDNYLRVYVTPQGNSPDIILGPVNEDQMYTFATSAYPNKSLVLAQDKTVTTASTKYITGTTITVIGT